MFHSEPTAVLTLLDASLTLPAGVVPRNLADIAVDSRAWRVCRVFRHRVLQSECGDSSLICDRVVNSSSGMVLEVFSACLKLSRRSLCLIEAELSH